MMKIGFSSLACPGWDLNTIIIQASQMGYDGIELRGLRGELHLPLAAELTTDPQGVRNLLQENNVELICLGSSATLDSKERNEVARQKGIIIEYLELAQKLGCPTVRLFVGEVQEWDNRRQALSRVADTLRSLTSVAQRLGVTLLIENGGDFSTSVDLWFLVDAVSHPNLQCCWHQCHALTSRERPTLSLPCLGQKIGMVHLCDATFDDQGVLMEYKPLGEGDAETTRQIDLLKGMVYDRYLVFEWPKLWNTSLTQPESILPLAYQFMREAIDAKQPILTAYKSDKHAPKLASPSAKATA